MCEFQDSKGNGFGDICWTDKRLRGPAGLGCVFLRKKEEKKIQYFHLGKSSNFHFLLVVCHEINQIV